MLESSKLDTIQLEVSYLNTFYYIDDSPLLVRYHPHLMGTHPFQYILLYIPL